MLLVSLSPFSFSLLPSFLSLSLFLPLCSLSLSSQIINSGHSRIPIFKDGRSDIVGLILVKKLIILDPDDNVPISEVMGAMIPPPSCSTTTPLYDILNQFQTGRSE